jgi:hypothetical protein
MELVHQSTGDATARDGVFFCSFFEGRNCATEHAASPTRYLTVDLDFFFERSPLILISCLYIKTDRGHELTTDCRLPSAPRAKCPSANRQLATEEAPAITSSRRSAVILDISLV